MGRKSSIKNKNVYLKSREESNLTRQKASELMDFVSEGRIEKIENGKSEPHPEEVLAMSEAYKKPSLATITSIPISKARFK